MFSFLVGAALLGQQDVDEYISDLKNRRAQERIAAQQRDSETRVAYDNREQERESSYVIAGAIVAGLVLLGLISRSSKK